MNDGPLVTSGVGSGDVGGVAVARGDTNAPVCDDLCGGVSGLQPISVKDAKNANNRALQHFEEMPYVTSGSWANDDEGRPTTMNHLDLS